MSGVGSLAIQLAKNMKVVALENDDDKLMCLENNSAIYEVLENINIIKGDIFTYVPEIKPELIVICPDIKISKSESIRLEIHLPSLHSIIERCFEISDSLVIIFSPTLDPCDFIENIKSLDLDICIEFILLFDHSHLKYIACLLGKLTKFSMPDIIAIILSKLGLSVKQRDFISSAIEQTSLKTVIQILNNVEREYQIGSAVEKFKLKAKTFFELLRQDENISFKNMIFLYKGENGDDVARNLEEMNLYFIEIDTIGPSILEINGIKLVGIEEILPYLEELKIKETPNKNSLFLLIGT